jgi:hypothetical protein
MAWLFRRIGAMKPIRAVWIRQYMDGDWENAHFKGEAARTWKYDADGLIVVDAMPEPDDASAIASTTPVVSFCADETGNRMIYVEWHGRRAGGGRILARKENGKWVSEKDAWIS